MSIRHMAQVWALDLPSTTKLVLLKLADNANDEGICWPSMNTVAKYTGISRRAVITHIKKLEELGLIEVIRVRQEAANLPNKYRLIYSPLVNDIHQGGERDSLGVVNDVHPNHKSEPSLNHKKKELAPPDGVKAETWEAFVEMRKKMKAPLTGRAAKLIANKLKTMQGDPDVIIEQSVINGWRGIFDLKDNPKQSDDFQGYEVLA